MRSLLHVLSVIFSLAALGLVAAGGVAGADPFQKETDAGAGAVPVDATFQGRHVTVRPPAHLKLPARDVEVQVATVGRKLIILPVVMLGGIDVLEEGGSVRPLFDEAGAVIPAALADRKEAMLRVALFDLERDPTVQRQLLESVAADQASAGRIASFADTGMQLRVSLQAADEPISLGKRDVIRAFGQVRHSLRFRLGGRELERLRRMSRDELTLAVSCDARCFHEHVDWEVTATVAAEEMKQLATQLLGAPDPKPALIVLAGGAVNHRVAANDLARGYREVVIARWRNRQLPDPETLEKVLAQVLAFTTEQVALKDQNNKELIAVLLNDRLALRGAIGDVKETVEGLLSEDENKAAEAIEKIRANSENSERGHSGSFGYGGVAVSGTFVKNDANSNIKLDKKFFERYRRELVALQRALKGEVSTVTAIRAEQLQKAVRRQTVADGVKAVEKEAIQKTLTSWHSFEGAAAAAAHQRQEKAELEATLTRDRELLATTQAHIQRLKEELPGVRLELAQASEALAFCQRDFANKAHIEQETYKGTWLEHLHWVKANCPGYLLPNGDSSHPEGPARKAAWIATLAAKNQSASEMAKAEARFRKLEDGVNCLVAELQRREARASELRGRLGDETTRSGQ